MDFLNILKLDNKSISTYDLYCQYTEYNKKNSKKNKSPIIDKKYFDLFINEYLKDYINDNFIILSKLIEIKIN